MPRFCYQCIISGNYIGTTFFLPSFFSAFDVAAADAATVEGVFFSLEGGLAGLSNVDTPPAAPSTPLMGGFSVADLIVFVPAVVVVVVPDAATTTGTAATVVVLAAAVAAAVEHNFSLSIPSNSTGVGPLGTTV